MELKDDVGIADIGDGGGGGGGNDGDGGNGSGDVDDASVQTTSASIQF